MSAKFRGVTKIDSVLRRSDLHRILAENNARFVSVLQRYEERIEALERALEADVERKLLLVSTDEPSPSGVA